MQNVDQKQSASQLVSFAGSRALFPEEVRSRVQSGARLVRFEFCVSFLFATIRRQSPLYLTESWQDRYLRGMAYSLFALLLGPWGIPWGLIWTLRAIWVNLTGGVDETEDTLEKLQFPPPSESLGKQP